MSKVIITNTLGTPIFIGGTLLSDGMSMEVDAHDVPECLQATATPSVAGTGNTTAPSTAPASQTTVAPTDEELLVAAAKAKSK